VCFLAQEISTDTYLNIMAQYRPCYKAFDVLQLVRAVNRLEFLETIDLAYQRGLNGLDRDYTSLPLKLASR